MPASPATPATPAVPAVSALLAVLVMTLLVTLQPVSTDLYLPALPMLVADLGTTVAAVQLTLSALMVSYGAGQLVWGPVSDRFGRRPVLLAGLGLYVASALSGAFAPSVSVLVACRVLQGAALGSAVVCARAMVRDLYEPVEGTRIMTLSLSGVGVISMTVPMVGGWLAAHWGWRAALAASAMFALATLALIALRVPETLRDKAAPVRAGTLVRGYAGIARSPAFLTWTMLCAFGYAANFGFYATSSFVFVGRFGLSAPVFGAVLGSASIAYLLGTLCCRRWVGLHGVQTTVRRGGWLTMSACALFVLPALADAHTPWTLSAAIWLQLFAYGIQQPCGQVGMVAPFPAQAGSASALGGCVLALGGFVAASVVGAVFDGSARSLALATGVLVFASGAVALALVPRFGMQRALAVVPG
ncbi:Bcr/CflA family multidrug efflux MFS transporter [soil metagenome]